MFQFTSQEVAAKVLALKSGRFLNNETLSFEAIPTSHLEISAILVQRNEERLWSAQNVPVLNSKTPSFVTLPSEGNWASAITEKIQTWLDESAEICEIRNEKDFNKQEEAALSSQFNASLNLKDDCSTQGTAVNFSGISSPFDKVSLQCHPYHTRLGVRQTVPSRNRVSSLNILACSSRSAQPLSRLPPNLDLRPFWPRFCFFRSKMTFRSGCFQQDHAFF